MVMMLTAAEPIKAIGGPDQKDPNVGRIRHIQDGSLYILCLSSQCGKKTFKSEGEYTTYHQAFTENSPKEQDMNCFSTNTASRTHQRGVRAKDTRKPRPNVEKRCESDDFLLPEKKNTRKPRANVEKRYKREDFLLPGKDGSVEKEKLKLDEMDTKNNENRGKIDEACEKEDEEQSSVKKEEEAEENFDEKEKSDGWKEESIGNQEEEKDSSDEEESSDGEESSDQEESSDEEGAEESSDKVDDEESSDDEDDGYFHGGDPFTLYNSGFSYVRKKRVNNLNR